MHTPEGQHTVRCSELDAAKQSQMKSLPLSISRILLPTQWVHLRQAQIVTPATSQHKTTNNDRPHSGQVAGMYACHSSACRQGSRSRSSCVCLRCNASTTMCPCCLVNAEGALVMVTVTLSVSCLGHVDL